MAGGLRWACAAVLLLASPSTAASPKEIAPWLITPRGWEADIALRDEPGGRFVIEGRVLGAGDSVPLAGVTLYAYHADGKGWYALTRDAPYPRLAGVLRTDARGRYRVRSILPGMSEGQPHVHFEAWGPNLAVTTWAVNLYMGPNEKPDRAWGHMASLRRLTMDPERTETYVTRDAHGVFHASYDLRLDQGFPLPAHTDSLRRGLVAR